jgi:hypothetical protein
MQGILVGVHDVLRVRAAGIFPGVLASGTIALAAT